MSNQTGRAEAPSPEAAAGPSPRGLDPADWEDFRAEAHRMLDTMVDHMAGLADGPVRRPIPPEIRSAFETPLPREGAPLPALHQAFAREILPYGAGNAHPRFMGWVQGAGTAVGMAAEMLAAGLNANLGGRDQAPLEVERQVTRWMAELFGFPRSASGVFLTGASMANFVALIIARTAALGPGSRAEGLAGTGERLVGYTSAAAHGCVVRAFEMAGLGSEALRRLPVDAAGRLDPKVLERAISADRAAGLRPFLAVATAGSVDTGAIDPLAGLAEVAEREGLWFHIDGALGALAVLSPELAPRFAGIERADSLAFDFHKWGQVPYDAGFLLVRDRDAHLDAFASPAAYLQRGEGGLFGGSPWPCDFGPDLSRGFRALKTWFTFKAFGADRLGEVIAGTCRLAEELASRVEAHPELESLAPVGLNIVCFRYRPRTPGLDLDALNHRVVVALQDFGLAAPSTTVLPQGLAIRAAIVNHRTASPDIEALVDAVVALGRAEAQRMGAGGC